MLSIRLSRVGSKKRPVYRIVVMPKRRDPWADVTEILGHYNPTKQPKEIVLKADRIQYWISKGAEVTNSVWNMLVDEKVVEGEKRTSTHISKKRKGKMEEKAEAAKEKEAEAKTKAEAAKAKEAEEKAAAKEAAKAEAEAAAQKATPEPAPEEAPAEEAAAEAQAPAEQEKPAEEAAA